MRLEDVVTIPEAAAMLGVSRQAIHYWISVGILPVFKRGTHMFIRLDTLMVADQVMAKTGKGVRGKRKKV